MSATAHATVLMIRFCHAPGLRGDWREVRASDTRRC
jgi:hypothetical protein